MRSSRRHNSFRVYSTGELLHEIPLGAAHERSHGAKYYHLHRADLHAVLAAKVRELDPDAVVLRTAAESYTETRDSVTVKFANGTTASGDLLIGADGIKSAIRAQILGATKAEFTNYVSWRATVPSSRLPSDYMERVSTNWMGPNAHVIVYYIRRGELLNFVGLVEDDTWLDESWTVKAPWARLKADFTPWHPKVQMLIDAMDKDNCYRWAMYNRPPVTGWSTARATLLGDAAHPTLPFMAQGAAMAIEDGAIIMRALEAGALRQRGTRSLSAQSLRAHGARADRLERDGQALPPAYGRGSAARLRRPRPREGAQRLALLLRPMDRAARGAGRGGLSPRARAAGVFCISCDLV